MFRSVDALLAEHAECERAMADPAVIADQARLRGGRSPVCRARWPVVAAYHAWHAADDDQGAARGSRRRGRGLRRRGSGARGGRASRHERLGACSSPATPTTTIGCHPRIKAGEGGEESALFAGDLLRMYLR